MTNGMRVHFKFWIFLIIANRTQTLENHRDSHYNGRNVDLIVFLYATLNTLNIFSQFIFP